MTRTILTLAAGTVLGAFAFAAGLAATPLTVTHEFQTGQVAQAAEVNQNFADVVAAVNGHDTQIDAHADRLGDLEGAGFGAAVAVNDTDLLNGVEFLAATDGYLVGYIGLLAGSASTNAILYVDTQSPVRDTITQFRFRAGRETGATPQMYFPFSVPIAKGERYKLVKEGSPFLAAKWIPAPTPVVP